MHIFFIRHGETTGDVEGRFGGSYDDHLTEHGFMQSEALATTLKDTYLEELFVSPLVRARETADIVARAGGSRLSVITDFRERDQYGPLSGMLRSEAQVSHPAEVEALKDRLNTIAGAETYEAFSERIHTSLLDTIARARESGREKIGIVWHGGPQRVLFRDILRWGELTAIGDCCYVELEFTGSIWSYRRSEGIEFGFELPR